jgi:crossover junction endodeoxyribonuclease RuvC
VFRFDRNQPVSRRLSELQADFSALLKRSPADFVCVESLFAHYAHPRTAIIMAHARGVILLTIAAAGVPLIELPPATVKRAITGHGRASKPQVQAAVAALFDLPAVPEPPDVADAIAVAVCGSRRLGSPLAVTTRSARRPRARRL